MSVGFIFSSFEVDAKRAFHFFASVKTLTHRIVEMVVFLWCASQSVSGQFNYLGKLRMSEGVMKGTPEN